MQTDSSTGNTYKGSHLTAFESSSLSGKRAQQIKPGAEGNEVTIPNNLAASISSIARFALKKFAHECRGRDSPSLEDGRNGAADIWVLRWSKCGQKHVPVAPDR